MAKKEGGNELERMLNKYETAGAVLFDNLTSELNTYFTTRQISDEDLQQLQQHYSKYNKLRAVNGKGKVLKGLGTLLLKYGNGSSFARETAEDLCYMLTNRNMSVRRYIALEAIASAPLYNGTKFNNQNLSTYFIEYLCNAVESSRENIHFRRRSVEVLSELYPRLKAAKKEGRKARYRPEITSCISKVREAMRHVTEHKSVFGEKTVEYATNLLK